MLALRAMAADGAGVYDMVRRIQTQLGRPQPDVIPTLAYFKRAFSLPLPVVLPLREWLGSERDPDIDASILAAIEGNREEWSSPAKGPPIAAP